MLRSQDYREAQSVRFPREWTEPIVSDPCIGPLADVPILVPIE